MLRTKKVSKTFQFQRRWQGFAPLGVITARESIARPTLKVADQKICDTFTKFLYLIFGVHFVPKIVTVLSAQ